MMISSDIDVSQFIDRRYYVIEDHSTQCPHIHASCIIQAETAKTWLCWEESCLTLSIPVAKLSRVLLTVLLEALMDYCLQKQHTFILHASSFSDGKRAMLLFGNTGSGKTTLAMHLWLHYKMKFVANGATLVQNQHGRLMVIGASKPGIKLRKSSVSLMNRELEQKVFQHKAPERETPEIHFEEKKIVSPLDLGIEIAGTPVPLASVVRIKLNAMVSTGSILPWDANRARLELYANLTRHVRGTDLVLVEPDGKYISYFPGVDTMELYRNRIDFINTLIDQKRLFTAFGPLEDTGEKIYQLLYNDDC